MVRSYFYPHFPTMPCFWDEPPVLWDELFEFAVGERTEFRGAHASRVLVWASRPHELCL